MRKIISRPNPGILPNFSMPVYVRSAGYNEAEFNWQESVPGTEKPFVQLFWCLQGAGEFTLDDRKVVLCPGDTFVHLPGEEHRHRACDPQSQWRYTWFTFDGPSAESFYTAYGYPREVLHSGDCPMPLFLELERLVQSTSAYAQRHALSVAAEIMALAGGTGEAPEVNQSVSQKFIALATGAMQDPEITVEKLAEKLQLHRTTLNLRFQQETGITPGAFIDQLRLHHALNLLQETDIPIKEAAQHCGFSSASYFCRTVMTATGLSPAEYRKKYRSR